MTGQSETKLTIGTASGHNANIIYAGGDDAIAQVYGIPSHCHVENVDPVRYGEGLANAARIALTWNCHDELVAALRRLVGSLEMMLDVDGLSEAHAALAKASA